MRVANRLCHGKSSVIDLELSQTFVNDRLDLVDSDLAIADVTTQFGPYTSLCVEEKVIKLLHLVSGIALNNAHCIHWVHYRV